MSWRLRGGQRGVMEAERGQRGMEAERGAEGCHGG